MMHSRRVTSFWVVSHDLRPCSRHRSNAALLAKMQRARRSGPRRGDTRTESTLYGTHESPIGDLLDIVSLEAARCASAEPEQAAQLIPTPWRPFSSFLRARAHADVAVAPRRCWRSSITTPSAGAREPAHQLAQVHPEGGHVTLRVAPHGSMFFSSSTRDRHRHRGLESVFDRFRQVRRRTDGLPRPLLARCIVEAMAIDLASPQGVTASFHAPGAPVRAAPEDKPPCTARSDAADATAPVCGAAPGRGERARASRT